MQMTGHYVDFNRRSGPFHQRQLSEEGAGLDSVMSLKSLQDYIPKIQLPSYI